MTTHDLKTWPHFFESVETGIKLFELRKDDRDFKFGDFLRLREWDPETGRYTGRERTCEVIYLMRGPAFGLASGYVCMSIKPTHI